MTDVQMRERVTDAGRRSLDRLQVWLPPVLAQKPLLLLALLLCFASTLYWGLVASDRYVSEAHVLIQHTDLAGGQSMDFGSILTGASSGARADQLLMRDYLLSTDMLQKLDAQLGLRRHFSDPHRDPLSRLWSEDVSAERFYRYFRSRVSVEYDEYAGVLVIQAQAYEPKMARDITALMVQEGENHMNGLAHRLAREQVEFLQGQVEQLGRQAAGERQKLIAMQNEKGMVSPRATAESLAEMINRLDAQVSELRARRSALSGYLATGAPGLVELDLQIAALQQQMGAEQARLVSAHDGALNRTVEEFRRQEMTVEFATDVYKTALVALEKGRVEATRTLKKVSVLQSPSLPEYPLQPQRLYNILVSLLVTALMAGVTYLLMAIIRDHRD